MKKIKSSKFYNFEGKRIPDIVDYLKRKQGGVYIPIKILKCAVCKKKDLSSPLTDLTGYNLPTSHKYYSYAFKNEIIILGDEWAFIQETEDHTACREIIKLGLFL